MNLQVNSDQLPEKEHPARLTKPGPTTREAPERGAGTLPLPFFWQDGVSPKP